MSLPTREEILEKAKKLFIEEQIKAGLPAITPEEGELKEGSYFEEARKQLMREMERATEVEYLQRMASEIGMRVVPSKLAERAEELPIVERSLREEREKRREIEKDLERRERETGELERKVEELGRRAEVMAPAIEVAPPPIREPVTEGEVVVSRNCYPIFSNLWNAIKKGTAMEASTLIVSRRTGIGAGLISEALSYARTRNVDKIEKLTNRLLECQCTEERG